MDDVKVNAYYTEWWNPTSEEFKTTDADVGARYLDCSKIVSGAQRKSDATTASICGYLKFDKMTRYFGCDATTNCTYAGQIEKATADQTRGGHFLMQFPACESMKSVFSAICQGATPAQIDTFIASQRISGTSWIPSSAQDLGTKCKNKADGGVEFALSGSSGSGETTSAPATTTTPAPGISETTSAPATTTTPAPGVNSSSVASPMWVLSLAMCLASAVSVLRRKA